MENNSWQKFISEHFILYNCLYGAIIALLYTFRGFQDGFKPGIYVVIAMNLLSILLALVFKKKGFSLYYLCYAVAVVFVIAFDNTYLFNNYSALFMLCIVIMLQPKLRLIAIILYFSAICLAFILNSETPLHLCIHTVRSVWFIQIVSYAVNSRFERKKLVLFEDEIKILEQLCSGKVYQKEVEGFSENTIYRKLKAARERNGNLTRDQLLTLYKQEKTKKD